MSAQQPKHAACTQCGRSMQQSCSARHIQRNAPNRTTLSCVARCACNVCMNALVCMCACHRCSQGPRSSSLLFPNTRSTLPVYHIACRSTIRSGPSLPTRWHITKFVAHRWRRVVSRVLGSHSIVSADALQSASTTREKRCVNGDCGDVLPMSPCLVRSPHRDRANAVQRQTTP